MGSVYKGEELTPPFLEIDDKGKMTAQFGPYTVEDGNIHSGRIDISHYDTARQVIRDTLGNVCDPNKDVPVTQGPNMKTKTDAEVEAATGKFCKAVQDKLGVRKSAPGPLIIPSAP